MNTSELTIQTLLDLSEWDKFQEQFSKLTGTAIMAVDFRGNPLSRQNGCSAFCAAVRSDPVLRKRCIKCAAMAGMEAAWQNDPFVYLCHCGLECVAVPVIVRDHYLGAVLFGQARRPAGENNAEISRQLNEVVTFRPEDGLLPPDLQEKYSRLPVMEYWELIKIAGMIEAMLQYTVDRIQKARTDALIYSYKNGLGTLPLPDREGSLPGEASDNIEGVRFPPNSTGSDGIPSDVPVSSPVYPAVTYIERNRQERVSMQDMAKLCHLSPSYFSKLFLKETGENFTDFVNRKKIGWAMEALQFSERNITQISLDLGFQDSSYFVKVFKKYIGLTPSLYREMKRIR